jgi:long-chain fatty acid transport protein
VAAGGHLVVQDPRPLRQVPGLFADQGSFDIPANYGVGLAYQPSQDWTLALDYQVIQYSGVKSVGTPLAPLLAGQPLGADGPGFGWKDVQVVKLGAAYQWSPALTLRAGYSHATQPVPQSQTFFNILAPGWCRTMPRWA